MVYLCLTGEVIKSGISKNRSKIILIFQTREVIKDEYNFIFLCEINIFISQQECHILPQSIKVCFFFDLFTTCTCVRVQISLV